MPIESAPKDGTRILATGGDAVFNRDGAEALGKLLREMARILDTEIEARRMISTQSESPIP